MMNKSEIIGSNRSGEAPDRGMSFGESRLSDVNFEPREFPEQAPNETDREYAEREMRADERIFLVGLVKAEAQGPDGMIEALGAPDFRLKRSQKREFLNAVGKMSEEEYGARVNSILGVFTNDEAREAAMDIADYYWLSAKRQAGDTAAMEEAENTVSRTHHEKPRKYRWRVEERPKIEMPRLQAEVMLASPQKYYREQKQERRGKKLFEKIKGILGKFKKEEEIPRRVRSGVEPEDFADKPMVSTPQLDVAVRENGGWRHEADGSIDVSESRPQYELGADGYPAPVPAGKLFRDTNFYNETQPGQYFGQEEDIAPETTGAGRQVEAEPYAGRRARREERGPLHTNDFSFGEEGSF